MKILKVIAGLLGLVVVVIMAAMIIVPLVVEPNDFRDEIVARVKEATGRDLQINGDIELSLFPWLGLELGELKLSNAKGFDAAPFAAIRQAAVKVKILPLLHKRVEVDRVLLDGLTLNLARAGDGRTNWDDLTGAEESPAGAASAPASDGSGENATPAALPLAGVAVGGVTVSNANIRWHDERSGQQIAIEQLNLRMGAILPGRPVDLTLDFRVENQAPAIQAAIRLSGSPQLSAAMDRLTIDRLALAVDAQGELLNGKPLQLRLESGVALDLPSRQLQLDSLQLDLNGLLLQGRLSAGLADEPAFSGELKLAELNLREWLTRHELPLPATADARVFTRVALALRFDGNMQRLDLKPLTLMLDDSRLTGDLKLNRLASAMPAVGFHLGVDAIDLDRYLPATVDRPTPAATPVPTDGTSAPTGGAAPSPAPATKPAAQPELFPVELLRQLEIDGLFQVGRLRVKKLLAEDTALTIKAKGGHIEVSPQIKKFYQGGFEGRLVIDVRGKEPRLQITKELAGVQLEPLLQDLSGNGRLRGVGRFSASLKTRGNTEQALRRHLDGKLGFRFENGAVKGIDLAQTIRETWARIKGKPIPPANEKPETDFSELAGTAVITRGVLVNKDLMAKSPFLRVDGKGQVDLVRERLDYKLTTTIVKSMEGQGARDMQDLMGVPVPVRISGSFAAPEVRPDMQELAKRLLRGKVEQKIEEKLKGKLPGALQGVLKGLF